MIIYKKWSTESNIIYIFDDENYKYQFKQTYKR
jgi:hypothetical protein